MRLGLLRDKHIFYVAKIVAGPTPEHTRTVRASVAHVHAASTRSRDDLEF
jgi:hypothetical protein